MTSKYIPSTRHEWSSMDLDEFERVCKSEKLEKLRIEKFKKPPLKFILDWAESTRGNIVRYASNRTGTVECRGGGVLLMLGLKENKAWPEGKSPEFLMIQNAYNPSIKPFSVQIKHLVSFWYATSSPKRIIMNHPMQLETENKNKVEPQRPSSPKSPKRSSVRKVRL